MQTQIQEFNQKLVEENQDIVIVDYVKVINEKHFNINISFIDDFIDMVDKDGFNISHEMLVKYEILTKSDSAQVARLLEIQNFEDGVDYSCINTVIDDDRLYKYPLRFEGELITS